MAGRRIAALLTVLALVFWTGAAARAEPRDQVRIVGSSTIFPFAATVAETLARTTAHKAPFLEATGTGGGFKVFCAGLGLATPDMIMASRSMTGAEREICAKAAVGEVREIPIGYDGIVLVRSRGAGTLRLTRRHLWLALAQRVPVNGRLAENPYQRWSEVDPWLPDEPIRVYGPPPTSGTRDVLVSVVMNGGCSAFRQVRELEPDQRRDVCAHMREDGVFIEAGEDDDMVVRRLIGETGAVGIVGFNALRRHAHLVQGLPLEGVAPAFDAIRTGAYPLSRRLYLYLKAEHLGTVPGLKAYVKEFTGEAAVGEDGYLTGLGLIPLVAE